ncbi:MAG: hypothetical protein R8G66_16805 [Cytophagales bacterium]|nr:hypothetical protein [Cytophagales bacterium]
MKVLFVSVAFPPKRDPECLQTARYVKYLNQFEDVSIEVITSAMPTLYMPYDAGLDQYRKGLYQVYEVKLQEYKLLNSIIHRVKPGLLFPDSKRSFIKQALAVNTDRPDIIYSRSFPISSTLAAYRLSLNHQVPWVMHMSDPWSAYPLHDFSPAIHRKHKAMEEMCLDRATAITFTSKKTIELYKSLYPQHVDKFHYQPNVYDDEDVQDLPLDFNRTIKVVYTGGMIGSRNPSYFFEAFKQLSAEDQEKFEIQFVGQADRSSEAMINDFSEKVAAKVTYLGPKPYSEAIKFQNEAHLLLLVDNPLKPGEEAIFFPSKILDYFIAKRKIIAITPQNSTTSEVLKDEHHVYHHNETQQLADFLKEATVQFEAQNHSFFQTDAIPEFYSARYQAGLLYKLLSSHGK